MTVDDFLGEPGASLYHYTTLATALEHIVPTRKLRMSPFSSMRDPRESRTWSITAVGYGALEHDPDSLRDDTLSWVEFNAALQERKLTRDDPAERQVASKPFGRGFSHPRLWEQYADNHRGVCLGFDLGALIDDLTAGLAQVGPVDHGPVLYEDAVIAAQALTVTMDEWREHGVETAVSNHVRPHIAELFFTKLKDWLTPTIPSRSLSPYRVRYAPSFWERTSVRFMRRHSHLAKIGTPPQTDGRSRGRGGRGI